MQVARRITGIGEFERSNGSAWRAKGTPENDQWEILQAETLRIARDLRKVAAKNG